LADLENARLPLSVKSDEREVVVIQRAFDPQRSVDRDRTLERNGHRALLKDPGRETNGGIFEIVADARDDIAKASVPVVGWAGDPGDRSNAELEDFLPVLAHDPKRERHRRLECFAPPGVENVEAARIRTLVDPKVLEGAPSGAWAVTEPEGPVGVGSQFDQDASRAGDF